MDLRSVKAPIKDSYRSDPDIARIDLSARAGESDSPVACSGDLEGDVVHQTIKDPPRVELSA